MSTGLDRARVPLSRSGWPVPRAPRWLLVAGALLMAGVILVGLSHRPSTAQRAADLRGFLSDMWTGIESCAGGVSESLYALNAITAGTSHDAATAIRIATYGAGNCSPANNTQLDDLVQYQVTESLASFRLARVVNDLVTWAFPLAQRVQADVAAVLRARTPAAKAQATATLRRDRLALDAQRAAIDKIITSASTTLSAHAHLSLPG